MTAQLTPATVLRLGGPAAIIAGFGFALFMLLHPAHVPDNYERPIWLIAHAMPHLGATFGVLGLTALYARLVERAGWFGLFAYVVAVAGNCLILMMGWVELFIMPFIELRAPRLVEGAPPPGMELAGPLTMAVFAAGYGLFGLVVAWTGVWPRVPGLLLGLGALLFAFGELLLPPSVGLDPELPMKLGGLLLGGGLIWLGLARSLMAETQPEAERDPVESRVVLTLG